MNKIGYLFIIWVVLTVFAFFVGRQIFDSSDLQYYAYKGEPIYGTVINKDAENHQLIYYTYEVNGISYSGHGRAGAGNPLFNKINIGERVVIFFDPASPGNSLLGYPQYDLALNQQLIWAVTVTLPIIPVIALAFLFFALARKQSNDRSAKSVTVYSDRRF
ncbi:MAG: hypothetical protein ACRD6X_17565 [Pyrinomonadaceae bacterium]